MTRPHYQQIADAIYAERRAECDPLAVLAWEAEHGTGATRDQAIEALREWEAPSLALRRWILALLLMVWGVIVPLAIIALLA